MFSSDEFEYTLARTGEDGGEIMFEKSFFCPILGTWIRRAPLTPRKISSSSVW
jgi:hypothetical protein